MPLRPPGTTGRPGKHGGELAVSAPGRLAVAARDDQHPISRYGMAVAAAWDRVHLRLTHRPGWLTTAAPARHRRDADPRAGGSPARRPGPKPVWLW